eukprot:174189-Rhodomonas_salina.1
MPKATDSFETSRSFTTTALNPADSHESWLGNRLLRTVSTTHSASCARAPSGFRLVSVGFPA